MSQTARHLAPYQYKMSILIPMFNEDETILFILNKVKSALSQESFEIIVVDDGSIDQSAEKVQSFISMNPHLPIQYHYQKNQGKGAAIRKGIECASGEILVVQDADLEYDPSDILPLIESFSSDVRCVYGSRNLIKEDRQHSGLFFYWGGLLVTYVTNFLFQSNLTDEATGYKLFHASLFEQFSFQHNDFAWEPEITAKLLKNNVEIIEKPIQYHPRGKSEGKKISWRDGVKAIWVLLVEYFRK